MAVELHGYQYSIYLRIVRMALAAKGVPYDRIEVNPFSESVPENYMKLNPFGRVPTLVHDGFVLYETTAITRYIDEAFEGPALQPEAPRSRARMAQIVAIIDADGYWPMVRQVFSQRIFDPRLGTLSDEREILAGIEGSEKVLNVLEGIAIEGMQLNGEDMTLADIHLAPVIAALTAAPEGEVLLARYVKLHAWWTWISQCKCLTDTDPGLPDWIAESRNAPAG